MNTWIGGELIAKGPDRQREIVPFDSRGPQALHGVAAFGNRPRRMFDGSIELLARLGRAIAIGFLTPLPLREGLGEGARP